MKIFLIYFLINFLGISFVLSQDCRSPAECYIRATAILNQDRDEMKINNDRLINKTLINEHTLYNNGESFTSEIKSELQLLRDEIKTSFNLYNEKLDAITAQIFSLTQRFNSFADSRPSIFNGLMWIQITSVANRKCLTDTGTGSKLIWRIVYRDGIPPSLGEFYLM
jgi:hypothetical protein